MQDKQLDEQAQVERNGVARDNEDAMSNGTANPRALRSATTNENQGNDVIFPPSVEEQRVVAHVVSADVAPFKWVEDEPDLEDEILGFETPTVKRRARVVSSKVAPFKWVADDE